MNDTAHSAEIWHDYQRMLPPIACGATMGGFYVTAAGSLIATLSRDLGIPPENLAILGSAFGVAMIISGLLAPWGLRFGPVWFLRLAPLLAVSGTVLLSWSPNVAVAVVGATVAGLAGSMMSSAAAATFRGNPRREVPGGFGGDGVIGFDYDYGVVCAGRAPGSGSRPLDGVVCVGGGGADFRHGVAFTGGSFGGVHEVPSEITGTS